MHQPDLKLSSRAELQLCLARCFLPPSRQADFDALCTDLPADLRELNSSLAVLGDGEIDELCDTLSTLPDATTVLATYSRLFLSPPRSGTAQPRLLPRWRIAGRQLPGHRRSLPHARPCP